MTTLSSDFPDQCSEVTSEGSSPISETAKPDFRGPLDSRHGGGLRWDEFVARPGVEHEANLVTIQRPSNQDMVVLDFNGHRICGEDLSGRGTGRFLRGFFLDRTAAADEQPQHRHRQSQYNQPQVHALFSLIADKISAVASTFDFAPTLPFP